MPNKSSKYGYGTNNTKSTVSKKPKASGVQHGRAENPMGRKGKMPSRSGVTYSTSTMNMQAGQRGARR